MTRLPVLDVLSDRLVLSGPNGETVGVEISRGYGDEEFLAAALVTAFEDVREVRSKYVEVRLHPPLAQVRSLTDLPPVAPRDLHALVSNQPTRFFRSVGAEALISAEWSNPTDRTVVRAATADGDLLETLERGLERGGRRVHRFVPMSAAGEPGPMLLTPRARRRERSRRLRTVFAATALAIATWLAAGVAYVADLLRDEQAIESELEGLDGTLARIDDLSARLSSFAPMVNAVRRQSADAAWVIERVAAVTAALPRGAHLHRLRSDRTGELTLEAHAPDALEVVEALSGRWPGTVRLDGNPQQDGLDAVPNREGVSRMERFTIRAQQGGP